MLCFEKRREGFCLNGEVHSNDLIAALVVGLFIGYLHHHAGILVANDAVSFLAIHSYHHKFRIAQCFQHLQQVGAQVVARS